jgi:hypothetical protein
MGDLFEFERGKIVGAHLAGASVTKAVTATLSEVISVYTNHGKRISVKGNSGRKSTVTEQDHCTLR